jgi:DNA-binding beta-propeller fold protein YncE
VGVVNTSANSLSTTIAVETGPVAIVETPDAKKLYVANNGAGTVSNFNTLGFSPRNQSPIPLSSPPIWLAARSDSQRVYVLEMDGKLATLDTTATAGPDTVTESTVIAPGAKYMVYDGHLNRLYIPSNDSTNGAQLVIVDASSSQPPAPVTVPIATVPPSARRAQDPCATTIATTLHAVAVAALPDGSRVYVGAYYIDGSGNVCPQVTVINTSGNTFKVAAAVPGFPDATDPISPFFVPVCADPTRFRFMMAAGGDSSRVYLSSCDGGNVNFIDTANDTYLLSMPAPASARPPINGNQPPPQNPVFLIAGP